MRVQVSVIHSIKLIVLMLAYTFPASIAAVQSAAGSFHQSGEWSTHAHDAQHTGVSPVRSQKLAKIHWQVPVDVAPPEGEIFIHYGSPVITAKNTVVVPVKTDARSFRVQAHDGTTGKKLWYRIPAAICWFHARPGEDTDLAKYHASGKAFRLFWVGIGKNDFFLQSSRATVALLNKYGVLTEMHETEGFHSWNVWRDYLNLFAPLLFREPQAH
jgi:S-formylglutathione hydrolase FrmB